MLSKTSIQTRNVGNVGMVLLNPGCNDDINGCGPSKVDYLDLTDPTAFSLLLNSQARSNTTGTYKYVRLEFSQGSADASSVRVLSGGVTKEFTYGGCGATSVALDNPITLKDGETLTINVEYDLSDGEVYWTAGGGSCTLSDYCLGGSDLSPSIVQ